MRSASSLYPLAGLLALLVPAAAGGQYAAARSVDDIDLPAPESARPSAPPREVFDEDQPEPVEDGSREEVFIPGRPHRQRDADVPTVEAAASDPESTGPDGVTSQRGDAGLSPSTSASDREVKPLVLPPADGAAQLAAAYLSHQKATGARSLRAMLEAERRIEELRAELGYQNLFSFSLALSSGVQRLLDADASEALRRALFSAELSPDSPHAQWTAARAALQAQPSNPGQWGRLVARAIGATWTEPRWRAAAIADAAAALGAALAAGAALTLVLIFSRHARYVLHDFWHLFPEGVSAWQTTPLALLALASPLAWGHSPFGFLFGLALASWFYLGRSERAVAAAALALFGALPLAADAVAERAVFAGTRAEIVWLVERGGLEGNSLMALKALGEKAESFPVVFALGREARRRGSPEATALLRRASLLRPDSVEASLELGNALLMESDLEGARQAYQRAFAQAPERPEPAFNLARLHGRRSQLAIREEAADELARAQEYAHRAIELEPALGQRLTEPDYRLNAFLASMPLPMGPLLELAGEEAGSARVGDQIALRLFGPVPVSLAPAAAGLSALLLAAVGLLGGALRPSAACAKCGRPVCRRCDAEVIGPGLCGQCLNAFAVRGAVDPQVRAAKELGILRYQRGRALAFRLSSLLAGSAHVLSGRTVSGALILVAAFAFAFGAAFSRGLVSAPACAQPPILRAIPFALAALGLVAVSVRYALALSRQGGTKARASAPRPTTR